MQSTAFSSLRDLVLHHGKRRGWSTQRHIAVACELDETALSRFLNGEQDIGARRTHALFRELGVPVEQYDHAYELLEQAQELARRSAARRVTVRRVAGVAAAVTAAVLVVAIGIGTLVYPGPSSSPDTASETRMEQAAPPLAAAPTATPETVQRTASTDPPASAPAPAAGPQTLPPSGGQPRVIVNDPLADPAAGVLPGPAADTATTRHAYEGGEYALRTVDPAAGEAVEVFLPSTYTDAALAITARIAGPSAGRFVRIGCRDTAAGGYALTLNVETGGYRLIRWDGGGPRTLREGTAPVLRPGGEGNRLELRCTGRTIAGSVNGVQVASVEDGTYTQGRLWIGAGSYDNAPAGIVDARFSNLVVTAP